MTRPSQETFSDYSSLESYLLTVFAILEGTVPITEAEARVEEYFVRFQNRPVPPRFEAFLRQLLEDKRQRDQAYR